MRAPDRAGLTQLYEQVRARTEALVEPLSAEDQVIQSMPDVSPSKWHLAHTTWFFETFLLEPFWPSYTSFDPHFGFLFNSYYEAVGPRHARPRRGLLSRPSLERVREYRRAVDGRMRELLGSVDEGALEEVARRVELGLNHEEQHQELLLMDIKHVLAQNPTRPVYRPRPTTSGAARVEGAPGWLGFDGGLVEVGFEGDGFCFDNETPRHRVFLEPFALADRVVTNREWLTFVEDGGYRDHACWLSDGWAWVQAEGVEAPLYWLREDGEFLEHTLAGTTPLELDAPVVHVSYYEADAYARWAGARLPTEAEWEHAATRAASPRAEGQFLESGRLHPAPVSGEDGGLRGALGDVWEWTSSAYAPYPGFRPLPGALGEYNGKFMCNQQVLRGGSCVTPRAHARLSYRNFFYPHQRWAFKGLRLAQDSR